VFPASTFLPTLNPIEPPWYGPVCPVVWEGWRREVSPYPDQQTLITASERPVIEGQDWGFSRASRTRFIATASSSAGITARPPDKRLRSARRCIKYQFNFSADECCPERDVYSAKFRRGNGKTNSAAEGAEDPLKSDFF